MHFIPPGITEQSLRSRARTVLVVFAIVSLIATYFAKDISFSDNGKRFGSHTDSVQVFDKKFQGSFEKSDRLLILGITNQQGIFQHDFLLKLDSLTTELEKNDLLSKIWSPTNIRTSKFTVFGEIKEPLIHFRNPAVYAQDSGLIYRSPNWTGSLFSYDARSVSLFLFHPKFAEKTTGDSLYNQVKQTVENYHFDEVHYNGSVVFQNYWEERTPKDALKFASMIALLMIVFLYFSFRTLWGVWLPTLIVLVSVAVSFAFIQLTGYYINQVMVLLPALLFIIGISSIIHLLSAYIDSLRKNPEKHTAIVSSVNHVGQAIFLTAFTTAVGFISLIVIDVELIKSFGIYTAAGVLLTFGVSIGSLPYFLVFIKRPPIYKVGHLNSFWTRILRYLFIQILRKRYAVLIAWVLIIGIGILGISKVKKDRYLTDNLPYNSQMRSEFDFFENNFSGLRTFELGIQSKDSTRSILELNILNDLNRLDTYLQQTYGIQNIQSPASLIKNTFQAVNAGSESFYNIPQDQATIDLITQKLSESSASGLLRSVASTDLLAGKITGQMKDIGSFAAREMDEELFKFIADSLSTNNLVEYRLIGRFYLQDRKDNLITSKLLTGLWFAFAVVCLIFAYLFRSIRIVLLSLFTNILPLVLIAGAMGFSGINFTVFTALIFTIGFGIAVDDTIHFISKLKTELTAGKSLLYALKRTYMSTGKAMVLTSFILSIGFLIFTFSDMLSTAYIGGFVSMTLVFALVADLTILPVLLVIWYGPEYKKKQHKASLFN